MIKTILEIIRCVLQIVNEIIKLRKPPSKR